jgi:hypothetical protein
MYTNCIGQAQNDYFGQLDYRYKRMRGRYIHAVLETLDGFVKLEKHIGLSNENPWESCVFGRKQNTIICQE